MNNKKRSQAIYCTKEIIKDYLSDELSVPKIANKQGISCTTVYKVLEKK